MIETLLRREYVWKKGNALVPSWTAFAKQQLLERHFAHLIDYDFTATMEEALDAIARGEGESEKWLHAFYFGNGTAGLRELVDEAHLSTIDPAVVNAVPIGIDAHGREIVVRVEQRRQPGQGDDEAPVPVELAPDELTVAAPRSCSSKVRPAPGRRHRPGVGTRCWCSRAGTARSCSSASSTRNRRKSAKSQEKPKQASLLGDMTPDSVTLEARSRSSLPASSV